MQAHIPEVRWDGEACAGNGVVAIGRCRAARRVRRRSGWLLALQRPLRSPSAYVLVVEAGPAGRRKQQHHQARAATAIWTDVEQDKSTKGKALHLLLQLLVQMLASLRCDVLKLSAQACAVGAADAADAGACPRGCVRLLDDHSQTETCRLL